MNIVFPDFRRVRIDPVLIIIESFCLTGLVSTLILDLFVAGDSKPGTVQGLIPDGVLLLSVAGKIFVLEGDDSGDKVDALLFHHWNEGIDVNPVF